MDSFCVCAIVFGDRPRTCRFVVSGLRGPSAESKSHTIAYIPYNRLQRYNQYTLPYPETSNAWNTHLRSSTILLADTRGINIAPAHWYAFIIKSCLSVETVRWPSPFLPVTLFFLIAVDSANSWDDLRYSRTNTLWLFNIAMGHGPFVDGLPINNGDFPWLC